VKKPETMNHNQYHKQSDYIFKIREYLSPRQFAIINLAAESYSNYEIAEILCRLAQPKRA
jgi:DNA-binding NarL/FixJ family response regulator